MSEITSRTSVHNLFLGAFSMSAPVKPDLRLPALSRLIWRKVRPILEQPWVNGVAAVIVAAGILAGLHLHDHSRPGLGLFGIETLQVVLVGVACGLWTWSGRRMFQATDLITESVFSLTLAALAGVLCWNNASGDLAVFTFYAAGAIPLAATLGQYWIAPAIDLWATRLSNRLFS